MEDNDRERLILLVSPNRAAGYLVTLVSAGISVAAQTEAAQALTSSVQAGAGRPVKRQHFSSGPSLGFPGFLGKSCIAVWIHM